MEIHILSWMMDIFFAFTLHILYSKTLGVKFKNKIILVVGWISCLVIWNIGSYLLKDYPIYNGICCLLINFLYLNFLYKGNLRIKIVLVFVVLTLGMVAETMVSFIFMSLGIYINKQGNDRTNWIYMGSAISKIFWFVFVKIMTVISRRNKQIKIAVTDWLEIFLVPIGSLIIFYIVAWDNYFNISVDKLVIFAVLFIINLLTYYIYQRVQIQAEEQIDKELIKQQNAFYEARYLDTQNQWENLKKIRHDMKNHYALGQAYLEEGRYEELKEYFEKATGNLANKENVIATGNIGVDSIINYKTEMAKEQQIKVIHDVRIEEEITIKNEDINILLGNLFDNAIEAASKTEARQIEFKLHTDKTALFFEIRNSYHNDIVRNVENEIVTTKADKKNHGLGMKAIKEIVGKYKGAMEIKEETDFFIVKIFLYM